MGSWYVRHVPSLRPIARDLQAQGNASPVAVVRWEHDHGAKPSNTPVTHSYATLAFYTGGGSRVELRGEWELRTGDCLLVPAGEPHRMLQVHSPELWGLAFCVPCFAAAGAFELLEPFERVRDGAPAVVHIAEERHAYLTTLFRELESLSGAEQTPTQSLGAIQRSLLTLILAEVDKASSCRGTSVGDGAGVVTSALRFIERNCLRPLTLGEVAAAVGRSPAHVTSALTRATGRSAGQWIVSGRMAEARRFLLHSAERVDVIAERVGYADVTHFIRMFRREHGKTPAAWRATHVGGRGAD